MGTTLEIRPETAEKLRLLADAQHVSVEDLLSSYVPGLSVPTVHPNGPEAEDPIRAFNDWAAGFPMDTPPLSEEAISRDSIYRDH